MSNLLQQVETQDPQLAADLKREVEALSGRRAFGLNFERHIPETVELPHRPVRRGDKVRFLPERGEKPSNVHRRLWRVGRIRRTDEGRVADLVRDQAPEAERQTASRAVDDLVVVAEFRDPIYPGLVSTGNVERGGDRPCHTVINAENFHALQVLLYTHQGKVDAIYIDPPYNTGARDWKYNNDYVEAEDAYRHSKWLAFMERRLRTARPLLNPEGSVLIVAIDEREVHRLALLLEQVFEDAEIQMVTSVISAKGVVRPGKFSRVEEHLFVVAIGGVGASPWMRNMLDPIKGDKGATTGLEWLGLRRREPTSERGARPNQFLSDLRGQPDEHDPLHWRCRGRRCRQAFGSVAGGYAGVLAVEAGRNGDVVGVDARGVAPELEERVRTCQQEGDCPVSRNGNHSGDSGRDHRGHRAGQGRFRSRYQTGRRRDAAAEARLERAVS